MSANAGVGVRTGREFPRGLVVGKFAPLHRGHELLIGEALARCDDVIVISYSRPERAGCEPEKRRDWLAARFPFVRSLVVDDALLRANAGRGGLPLELPHDDAPELVHRRFTGALCETLLGATVDAVFTSEDYGDGFAAELTTQFRERRPAHPVVRHVLVDRARAAVPISGTRIRADVHAHRAWLAPEVYATFVQRVCLLGGESSGKSSLAAALARRFGTECVAEYGRELWEAKAGRLEFDDLAAIAREHTTREEAAAKRAHRFVFSDTSPLTTLFYSLDLFGRAAPELERLATTRRYDVTVVCAPDFPFVQDGTRRDDAFRARQHAWYAERLAALGVDAVHARGPLDARVETVAARLTARADG